MLGRPDGATATLFADNPDALYSNAWVDEDGFRVLRASIEWQVQDNHGYDDQSNSTNARGTERRNVKLVALGEDIQQLNIPAIENRIFEPFRNASALLTPPLLSSLHEDCSPLYSRAPSICICGTRSSTLASLPLPGTDTIIIPDTLRRLVRVIVLAPEPASSNHTRSRSHHPRLDGDTDADAYTDADEDEDEDAPNESGILR
ncbi:hypothetical protein K438DRAFT_1966462 [Mycena galopus ATCC 62051]|nr:hypothetical protein K438DRAFT_1966462 [Mycena galopus ATCC 62051]